MKAYADKVDAELKALEEFAASTWSNAAIVDRVQHIRQIRKTEMLHTKAVRDVVCEMFQIEPGEVFP